MKSILLKPLVIVSICAGLTGCISVVNVEKFTGKEKGVRYSLPAAYLLVTPKSDGTASYDWVYLPDPENEYVVRTLSFMAKHTTDLTFDNGLLKKVTGKSDTAGVAAKMIDAAQSVYTARTAAAADAAKKEASKNAALQEAILDAELDLKQAQAELKVLEDNGALGATHAQLLAAKVKVAQAQAKLDAAKAAAKAFIGAMNMPEKEDPGKGQAWGPVLFRVVQTTDDVKLVAVNVQQRFETVSAVASSTPVPAPKQAFHIQGNSVFRADPGKSLEFKVVADQAIDTVDEKTLAIVEDRPGGLPYSAKRVTLTLQRDKKTVVVDISPCPPAGKYIMILPYSTKPGEKPRVDADIRFTVQ